MPDDPGIGSRATRDPAIASRSLPTDSSKQFFLDLLGAQSSDPVSPSRAREIKSRWGLQARNVKAETFREQKEIFYEELRSAIDSARRSLINDLSKDPNLAPLARPCDEILGVIITIVFTIVGMIGGSAEGAVNSLPALMELVSAVIKFLWSAAQAAFASGESARQGEAEVKRTIAALENLPAALWTSFQRWKDKFETAPTEVQSAMVGELTIEIMSVLRTAVGIGGVGKRLGGKLKPAKPKKAASKTPRAGSSQRSGQPGAWRGTMQGGRNMSAADSAYQRRVTGRSAAKGYFVDDVEFDGFKNGKLLDAKNFTEVGRFMKDERYRLWYKGQDLLTQAKNQVRVADGFPIEWHVPSDGAKALLDQMMKTHNLPITVVLTP